MQTQIDPAFMTASGFPYPDLSAAPTEIRNKYESLPTKINLFRMLAHAQGLYAPLMDFFQAIFKRLELSPVQFELLVLFTSDWTDTEYEWQEHLQAAPKAGVSNEQIEAIQQGRIDDSKVFNPDEQLLLRMADELLRDDQISDEALNEAKRVFSPGQILEVTLVVGVYRMLAGLIRSINLDFNSGSVQH